MGRHHARIAATSDFTQLTGIYDRDGARAAEIARPHGGRVFGSLEELMENSEAVVIAAPTQTHLEIGRTCLQRGLHILMEKPLAHSVEGARELVELADAKGLTLMVGHVERFNPATIKLMEVVAGLPEPIVSIHVRRLSPFDGGRCVDVDVFYDLMIHDVDLVLELAAAAPVSIHCFARTVLSDKYDVAHALMRFENGIMASIWTGKCSPTKTREIIVTTATSQYTADTLNGCLTRHTCETTQDACGVCFMGKAECDTVPLGAGEPLRIELEEFVHAVTNGRKPLVDGQRGLNALLTLDRIKAAVER